MFYAELQIKTIEYLLFRLIQNTNIHRLKAQAFDR